jgi:predicted ester cyclase
MSEMGREFAGSIPSTKENMMSVEANKEVVRRCWEEIWNRSNLVHADEVFAPDREHHFGSTVVQHGPEQVRTMATAWLSAFPDYRCHIEEVVGERDLVVVRLRFTGTHSGTPVTISGRTAIPRNRSFNESEILMFRMRDGKIVESWATWDRLSFLEQLGTIDAPA